MMKEQLKEKTSESGRVHSQQHADLYGRRRHRTLLDPRLPAHPVRISLSQMLTVLYILLYLSLPQCQMINYSYSFSASFSIRSNSL